MSIPTKIIDFFLKLLTEVSPRRGLKRIILITLLLLTPSFFIGFYADDYQFIKKIESSEASQIAKKFELYNFIGNENSTENFVQSCCLPWWKSPNLKINFFRPITSFTIYLDYLMFKRQAFFYHLHSILWYLLFILIIHQIFQLFVSNKTALLACFIFAINPKVTYGTIWIANRNSIVAATLICAAFWLYVRGRSKHSPYRIILANTFVGLSLLGGEIALSGLSLFIAYELFSRSDRWRTRLRYLAGPLCVSIGYLVFYKINDFGTRGSGMYLSPFNNPLNFIVDSFGKIPILLSSLATGIPADLSLFTMPHKFLIFAFLCTASLVCFFALLVPQWQHLSLKERATVKFSLAVALLATAPILAASAMDRLLLIAYIGPALIGAILIKKYAVSAQLNKSRLKLSLALLAVIYIVGPASGTLLTSATFLFIGKKDVSAFVESKEFNPSNERYSIFFGNAMPTIWLVMPVMREYFNLEVAKKFQLITATLAQHRVSRPTQNTLIVEANSGAFFEKGFELLLCRNDRFETGQIISNKVFKIEILSTQNGNPIKFAVEFIDPLSPDLFDFWQWENHSLTRIAIPEIGESFDVKGGFL